MFDRTLFIQSYHELIFKVWGDPDFLKDLQQNPAPILDAAGMPTLPGASINVCVVQTDDYEHAAEHSEKQADAWEHGNQTNQYELWIPSEPDDLDPDSTIVSATTCC